MSWNDAESRDGPIAAEIPSKTGVLTEGGRAQPAPATSTSHRARIGSAVRTASLETRFLWILLILFAAKGIIFTFIFPPFSGHDEVMHYAYLSVVGEEGRPPVIPDLEVWRSEHADPDVTQPSFDHAPEELFKYAQKGSEPKTSFTTSDWFGDFPSTVWAVTVLGEYLPSGWIYTANHPPLFYMLLTPLYWLVQNDDIDQQIRYFRLATIPLGMLTVLFAFLTVRKLFPGERFMAVVVPTLVAFQPQIAYESAMLNNDILVIAATSACIYLIAVGLQNRFTVGLCAWLGLALGLAVLSKQTAVIVMPVIALAMILRLGWKNPLEWLPKGAVVIAITAALVAPWYAYMLVTYGNLTALDRIKTLQFWNQFENGPPSILDQLLDPGFAWMRWRETWGEFGWRLIPLGDTLLQVLFWGFFATMIGLALWMAVVVLFRRQVRQASPTRKRALAANTDPIVSMASWQLIGVLSMVATCVLAYYAVLHFGTTFTLTQARYYFPAVNAAAIVVALGLRMLTPVRLQAVMQTAVFVGMFLLNVVILSGYVIPYWGDGL